MKCETNDYFYFKQDMPPKLGKNSRHELWKTVPWFGDCCSKNIKLFLISDCLSAESLSRLYRDLFVTLVFWYSGTGEDFFKCHWIFAFFFIIFEHGDPNDRSQRQPEDRIAYVWLRWARYKRFGLFVILAKNTNHIKVCITSGFLWMSF